MKKILLFAALVVTFVTVLCVSASAGVIEILDVERSNNDDGDTYYYTVNYSYIVVNGSDYHINSNRKYHLGWNGMSESIDYMDYPTQLLSGFNGFSVEIDLYDGGADYDYSEEFAYFLCSFDPASAPAPGTYTKSVSWSSYVDDMYYDLEFDFTFIYDEIGGNSPDSLSQFLFGLSPHFFTEFNYSYFPLSNMDIHLSEVASGSGDEYYYYLSTDGSCYIRWDTMDQEWEIRLPYNDGGFYEYSPDHEYAYGERVTVIMDSDPKLDLLHYILDYSAENCYIVNENSADYKGGYQEGYNAAEGISFNQGYESGLSKGKIDGYKIGFSDGEDSGYHNGYSKGYSEGELSGKSVGYTTGYAAGKKASDGYQSGYDKGKKDAFEEYVNISDGNAIAGMFQGLYGSMLDGYQTITDGIIFNGVPLRTYVNTFILIVVIFLVGVVIIRFDG